VFVAGDFQDVGRFTKQNPRGKVNATVDVGKQFGSHFLGGGVSGEWVHGLYMGDYSRQPIGDVWVMDLSVRYRRDLPERDISIEPYALARNLFDRRYSYVDGYPMSGFNTMAGLKIRM